MASDDISKDTDQGALERMGIEVELKVKATRNEQGKDATPGDVGGEGNDAFRGALMALLMHVRRRILAGEDPVELRQRLLEEEQLDQQLLDRVWVSLRPQLISEQEDKGMRLRVLGGIWVVAGVVLAVLVYRYPEYASGLVRVLSLVAIAAGVFFFQMGSRAAALGTKISSLDWSIQTPPSD